MRRRIPMIICFVSGLFMSIQFFIPHRYSTNAYENALDWIQIVYVFTLVVGIGSVIKHHSRKLMKLKPGWFYSIFTLVGLGLMAILGLFGGIEEGTPYMWIFKHVQAPMQATMMSLLAFFIASAKQSTVGSAGKMYLFFKRILSISISFDQTTFFCKASASYADIAKSAQFG